MLLVGTTSQMEVPFRSFFWGGGRGVLNLCMAVVV